MSPEDFDFSMPNPVTELKDFDFNSAFSNLNNSTAPTATNYLSPFGINQDIMAGKFAGSTPIKAPPVQSPEFWSMEGAMGGKSNLGWLTGGVQAITGLAGAYTGLKQLGLAEDSFDFQKEAFNTNLNNQAKLTNQQLRLAQSGRNARNPNEAVNLDDYMKQHGVQGAQNA